MGRRDARQFIQGRERWVARHDTRPRWSAEFPDEVNKAGVVVHEQDPSLALTDPRKVCGTLRGMETR
jgi:hypothetical protein